MSDKLNRFLLHQYIYVSEWRLQEENVAQLWLHLLILYYPTHQWGSGVISTQSTQDPILEPLWKFYPHGAASRTASFKGYCDPLLYLQPNECAFVCVFHYCSSEIAPLVPGAREAPDSALTRISTSVPRDNPTHRWGQDEISIHSRVEIRGSDRGWRKLKKRGIKGHKVSAV